MACAPAPEDELFLPAADPARRSDRPDLPAYDRWLGWTLVALGEPSFEGARVPEGMTIVRLVEMPATGDQGSLRLMLRGDRCTIIRATATPPGRTPSVHGEPEVLHPAGRRTGHDSLDRPVEPCRAAAAAADLAVRMESDGPPFRMGMDETRWVVEVLGPDTLRAVGRSDPDSLSGALVWRAGAAIRLAAGTPR